MQILLDRVSVGHASRILRIAATSIRHVIDTDELSAVRSPLGFLVDRHSLEHLANERAHRRTTADLPS